VLVGIIAGLAGPDEGKMSLNSLVSGRRDTFPGGIHPPEEKGWAADCPIEVLPTPKGVRIALQQHLGAPCEPLLKPRAQVALGDEIGRSEDFVSAAVHASVAGTIVRASVATLPNGRHVPVVPVRADKDQPLAGRALYEDTYGGDWLPEDVPQFDPPQIVDAARQGGLVGLGGAAFPTHVKLSIGEDSPIDMCLINGCECEPYLTADYRLMLEAAQPVVVGALLAARAVRATRVAVAVEANKPRAIEALRSAASGTGVSVQVLQTKYPQGGERQLISAVMRRTVPAGGLPKDVGVVVLNVGTTAALARAVLRGKPLTHRVVTVTGSGINEPKNLLVPIGVSYDKLIEYCGGLQEDAARVISGGPMMGFTVRPHRDVSKVIPTPVTKGTSGITILSHGDVRRSAETACVRCGRCVEICPMRLLPTRLALATRAEHPAVLDRYHVSSCVECGCCAYACPAGIPLVQLIRVGKLLARRK
jgi:electron transport complex protein RnfC